MREQGPSPGTSQKPREAAGAEGASSLFRGRGLPETGAGRPTIHPAKARAGALSLGHSRESHKDAFQQNKAGHQGRSSSGVRGTDSEPGWSRLPGVGGGKGQCVRAGGTGEDQGSAFSARKDSSDLGKENTDDVLPECEAAAKGGVRPWGCPSGLGLVCCTSLVLPAPGTMPVVWPRPQEGMEGGTKQLSDPLASAPRPRAFSVRSCHTPAWPELMTGGGGN